MRSGRVLAPLAAVLVGGACTANTSAEHPITTSSAGNFASLAIASVAAPSPRTSADIAYYPPDHEVVLFAGETPYGSGQRYPHGLGDTWVFDAHGWTLLHPEHSPSPRNGGLLIYDPSTRLLMLFGGYSAQFKPTTVLSDTWAWNGTDWRRLDPGRVPTWMPGASIAFDPASGYVTELAPLLVTQDRSLRTQHSGNGGPVERWLWTGLTWLSPPPMIEGTFADDLPWGDLLFFDSVEPDAPGCGSPGPCTTPRDPTNTRESQTWDWNGTRFSKTAPTLAPNLESLVVPDPRIGRTIAIQPSGSPWHGPARPGAVSTQRGVPRGADRPCTTQLSAT